jgi:hypothetical protein
MTKFAFPEVLLSQHSRAIFIKVASLTQFPVLGSSIVAAFTPGPAFDVVEVERKLVFGMGQYLSI